MTLLGVLQVAEYKDKLVRVLADMENLRDRTTRQAEQSRQFAIQVCRLPYVTGAPFAHCIPHIESARAVRHWTIWYLVSQDTTI